MTPYRNPAWCRLDLAGTVRNAGACCLAILLTACQTSDNIIVSTSPCTSIGGEFAPTDCAVALGEARNASGDLLVGLPIRVDSTIPTIGYVYASSGILTDASGHFELTVYRITRLVPRTAPDTATIGIKAYALAPSLPGQAAIAQARVLLRFAPLGATVEKSLVQATFALPRE